jgi:hypothetical protein
LIRYQDGSEDPCESSLYNTNSNIRCRSQHCSYSCWDRLVYIEEEDDDEEVAKKKNEWRQVIIRICMAQSYAFRSKIQLSKLIDCLCDIQTACERIHNTCLSH